MNNFLKPKSQNGKSVIIHDDLILSLAISLASRAVLQLDLYDFPRPELEELRGELQELRKMYANRNYPEGAKKWKKQKHL